MQMENNDEDVPVLTGKQLDNSKMEMLILIVKQLDGNEGSVSV